MIRQSLRNMARILPFVGAVLFFLPSLWTDTTPDPQTTVMRTSSVIVYLFAVWFGLIVLSIIAYGRIAPDETKSPQRGGE